MAGKNCRAEVSGATGVLTEQSDAKVRSAQAWACNEELTRQGGIFDSEAVR